MNSNDKKPQRRGLFVEHFGTPGNIPDSSDPIGVTSAVVAVDRISFFEKNPRRSPNERYEEIKESIRATGLDHPLPISRRPTDLPGHYFIYKGGNTRLRALKDLWEETKDTRFFNIRCEFHPFTSDTDALISHLRENDLRGDMTFIDRALAVQDAKAELEAELGESLSLRKLEAAFKQRGFPISNSMISRLEYAAKLNEVIPVALRGGVGKPQIERLAKLEKAARQVWQFHCNPEGSEQQFRTAVFLPALASSDSPNWTYDAAELQVSDKLLSALPGGVNPSTVKSDFKKAMDGKELRTEIPPEPMPAQREPVTPPAVTRTPTLAIDAPFAEGFPTDQLEPAYDPLDQYELLGGNGDKGIGYTAWQSSDHIRFEDTGNGGSGVREVIVEGSGRWLEKLKRLRQRNYAIALDLTRACPIPKASRSVTALDTGYGFLLTEVFNADFIASLIAKIKDDSLCSDAEKWQAERDQMQASNLWWLLAELCGLFPDQKESWIAAPDSLMTEMIADDSYMRNQGLLHKVHPVVPASDKLRTFWLVLPATQLELIFELIRNTVAITELMQTHGSQTNGATPWEVVTSEY